MRGRAHLRVSTHAPVPFLSWSSFVQWHIQEKCLVSDVTGKHCPERPGFFQGHELPALRGGGPSSGQDSRPFLGGPLCWSLNEKGTEGTDSLLWWPQDTSTAMKRAIRGADTSVLGAKAPPSGLGTYLPLWMGGSMVLTAECLHGDPSG